MAHRMHSAARMPENSLELRHQIASSVAALAAVVTIALGMWVLGSILDVLLLCFAGVLFGLFLHGPGAWMARISGLPTRAMVGTFCVLLLGLAALTAWLAAPSVATQIDELTTTLPRAFDKATEPLERHSWGRALLSRARHADEIVARDETWSQAGGAISSMLGSLGSFVVVVFVGLFTGFNPGLYRRGFLRLVPTGRGSRVGDILSLTAHTLRMWMVGKLTSMAVVGLGTWAGLALLEVPMALVLALLAAVLTFIPNFGPVLSAIPAILLAFLQGPTQALWVAGLYIGIQTVESYVLTPLMQKRLIALPPALTIVAQVVMGTLAGGLGIIIATPLTAAALVLVKEGYLKDFLGQNDRPETAGDAANQE